MNRFIVDAGLWAWSRSQRLVRRFRANDRGESSVMTNIMMLAIAAMVVVGLYFFGKQVWAVLLEKWAEITGDPGGGFKP